jgi:hypothetical protein
MSILNNFYSCHWIGRHTVAINGKGTVFVPVYLTTCVPARRSSTICVSHIVTRIDVAEADIGL